MKIVKVTKYNVLKKYTVSQVIKFFNQSGYNPWCMDNLKFKEYSNSEIREFHNSWDWIRQQEESKQLFVIDYIEEDVYLS